MRSFASDNNSGVHPLILEAVIKANSEHAVGYGEDPWTNAAVAKLKEVFGDSASPFFVFNGTGANSVALQAVTRPFHSILCAETAHIYVDECGAPARMTGCAVTPIPTPDGKLTPELIRHHLHNFGVCHHSQPRVVYISQASELGTVYTIDEVRAIADLLHSHNMYLHMDGARLANACAYLGCTMKEVTVDAGVDILSFGGTKNGMMMGEAVISFRPEITENLPFIRKQSAQLASKLRYMSAQFIPYLENNLWLENARHANACALRLAETMKQFPDIHFTQKIESNQLFFIMPPEKVEKLLEKYFFYMWDEERSEARLVTSWDTTEEDIQSFIRTLHEIIPISAEATDEDNEWTDEFGVVYSADRKELIKANELLEGSYEIKEGTVVICNNAFRGCESLESITIPSSVTSIGDRAFLLCESLKSINIPNSVTSIGNGAFLLCESLKSINIPNSVTSIGNGAFSECKNLVLNLESTAHFVQKEGVLYTADMKTLLCCFPAGMKQVNISVPLSVTHIGDHAFYMCESLKSVTIPNSVTRIGYCTFGWCSSLKSINIPNSVTSIEDGAFCGCKNLVLNLESTAHFVQKEGVLYTADMKTLLCCFPAGMKQVNMSVPLSVTHIGDYAFYGCESLKSITIPNSVTYIGDGAFEECSSLKSITIPDSVTSIEYIAFYGCKSLESISIPDSVTYIGDRAFCGCESLESISIPDSVTYIGDGAFCGCESLESISIPDSVTYIGDGAFRECSSLESISIPNSVTYIGNYTFDNCRSLKSITIPNSVTSIGDSTFSQCKSLKSITIPNSVTYIGGSAFRECESLESITIPNSATYIGDNTFSWCESLKDITIPNSVTSIGNSAFQGCESLESISIPNSVTSIGDSTFSWCESLKNITIPNSVTSIGNSAFRGCESLGNITIPNSVTSIGDGAFSGCENLILNLESTAHCVQEEGILYTADMKTLLCCFSVGMKQVYISVPPPVTRIGDYAFYGCKSLESIIIPNSVTNIGDSAFYGCKSLESIIIPNSITNIGDYAFYRCESLKSITIPNSVTNIGDYTFNKCESLKSITIPNSVTNIGDSAFYECKSLGSIIIPDSVTNIGDYAFYRCESLKSITIPNSVTNIGYIAFCGCKSLESIIIPNSVTSIDYAFDRCESLKSIFIPKGSRSKFENLLPYNKSLLHEI